MKGYYAGAKRVLVGGVPCRVARLVGEYQRQALRETGAALARYPAPDAKRVAAAFRETPKMRDLFA